MSDFKAKQGKILDAFGIGNVASAAGISSDPLRCYQVGDYDWFAATSAEQALELMRELVGDEGWDPQDYEVILSNDAELDRRWSVEGEPGADGGSLRERLEQAKIPSWICGIEP